MAEAERYLPPDEPGRCWLRSDRRRFAAAPRRVAELVALQAIRGRLRYLIDNRVLTLGPGALLWAHADQSHMLLSETPDCDMWVLVFAAELWQPAPAYPPRLAADYDAGARILPDDVCQELAAVARQLRGQTDLVLLAAGLCWWAARAWGAWRAAQRMAGTPIHPAAQRAAALLRGDPNVPLATVARDAGLSRTHLSRVFQRDTGRSLSRYRAERRLELVDRTMAAADAPPLLTAAYDAGFGSYAQFYRVFRRARGVGPRTYYRA